MKALYCTHCGHIEGLRIDEVTRCRCESSYCAGRWIDPYQGIAEFAESTPDQVYVLGIHNAFLATGRTDVWKHAAGYLFQTDRSPVVRIRPGRSRDTSLVPLSDLEEITP